MVYVLPEDVELKDLRFVDKDGRLSLHDGKNFGINLSDVPRGGMI